MYNIAVIKALGKYIHTAFKVREELCYKQSYVKILFLSSAYNDKDLISVHKISLVLCNVCIVMKCYTCSCYWQHAGSSFVLVYCIYIYVYIYLGEYHISPVNICL